MKTRKIKFVVNAVRWFDKVNGNTYHSVRITRIKDGKVIADQFQYGYGNQFEHTALKLMAKEKWLPAKYRKVNSNGSTNYYAYERENGYPILWNVTDGLKRECIRNGIVE